MSSPARLDLRVILEIPLRQIIPWLLSVLLVSIAGYPGAICVTPMAWLIALRVGNLVAWRSRSGSSSRRLMEAALAGGFFGFLQGILFAVVAPFLGPIQQDEIARTLALVLIILVAGTFTGAGLSFLTAWLNERKRISS
jgi:hypothetical protein